MNTFEQLMQSTSQLANVKPVSREFIKDNQDKLSLSYTGIYKEIIYAIWTIETPYQQYILAVDILECKVVSG